MNVVCCSQAEDSHEISSLILSEKQKNLRMSSAAVVIGALRLKYSLLLLSVWKRSNDMFVNSLLLIFVI